MDSHLQTGAIKSWNWEDTRLRWLNFQQALLSSERVREQIGSQREPWSNSASGYIKLPQDHHLFILARWALLQNLHQLKKDQHIRHPPSASLRQNTLIHWQIYWHIFPHFCPGLPSVGTELLDRNTPHIQLRGLKIEKLESSLKWTVGLSISFLKPRIYK